MGCRRLCNKVKDAHCSRQEQSLFEDRLFV